VQGYFSSDYEALLLLLTRPDDEEPPDPACVDKVVRPIAARVAPHGHAVTVFETNGFPRAAD